MKNKGVIIGFVLSIMVLVVPIIAGAQGPTGGINRFIDAIQQILARLVPLIIGLAVIVFLWGVLMYAIAQDDGGKEAAKGKMLWGLISLFVMVSVWGLVTILSDTLFGGARINTFDGIPQIPKSSVGSQ